LRAPTGRANVRPAARCPGSPNLIATHLHPQEATPEKPPGQSGAQEVAVPPGQAKYVTCVRGALRGIVVDLRVGSPAFGAHHVTLLDAESGRCMYVPEGVGHGFLSLTDDACICYVVSTPYVPGTQIDINPLDPDLALPWGFSEPPLMSEKDAKAPGVLAALASGLLADWDDVR
jgi:NDP-hexose 5-epimerase